MSGPARRRVAPVLVGVAVLVAAAAVWVWTSRPATASGDGTRTSGAPAEAPLRLDQVAGSVAYLKATYGIGTAEALRRLDLQREAADLDATLRRDDPATYGGMWIDQRGGGVLTIAATSPGSLAGVLRGVADAAHIRTRPVRFSLAQLDAEAARLASQINAAGRAAEVVTDEVDNVVAVYQHAGADAAGRAAATVTSLASAEQHVLAPDAHIDALVAAAQGMAVVRQLVVGADMSGTTPAPRCNPSTCPPPMRGGMRLDIRRTTAQSDPDDENPLWGECTVGFNLTSATGAPYVLTAGHCLVGANKSGRNTAYDNARHVIGTEVYDLENGPTGSASTYPVDYAIVPLANASFWTAGYPRNDVDAWCITSVSSSPCTNGTIAVTGYVSYRSAVVGTVVCATGSGNNDPAQGYHSSGAQPGTRCGEITGKNGGIKTNICSRKGDSGGPLFSEATGKAYGILNDGTAGHGNCPTNPPGTEWSQYSPIDLILANVKAQTLHNEGKDYGFALRTTP